MVSVPAFKDTGYSDKDKIENCSVSSYIQWSQSSTALGQFLATAKYWVYNFRWSKDEPSILPFASFFSLLVH
jgi:hypothetical protein